MAREIVITSVPRGVKLGRTGFQVAMQTAGMREDVAAVLEKMAGYRHLPAGAGANPVCYFHRVARTVAGQMHVLGRIVDAGVDFSNRSNKLAHMVVLEAADLSAVAAASPAAVLAAIEGRLASTWPGGPEERRQPFALAGIPPSQPAVCGLWQQVMGDAGWAGVIAERAVRNEPTLLIGPDSSPASCRRMLALFAEAIAIVPPAKRWGVTFDTTTLVADGVLWRGTYAGSPESQVAQPGVLIINLSAPQPVPQNLLAGELVQVARVGAPALPVGGLPVPPGGVPTARGVPVIGNPLADAAKTATAGGPAGGPGAPPPAPFNEDEWEDVPLGGSGRKRGAGGGLLVAGIVFALLAVLGIAAVGGFFVWTNHVRSQAFTLIREYAKDSTKPAPTKSDVIAALSLRDDSQLAIDAARYLDRLNATLASPDITEIKDVESLTEILKREISRGKSQTKICNYANEQKESPTPTAEDVCAVLGVDLQSPEGVKVGDSLHFLNAALSTKSVKGDDVKDSTALQGMLDAIQAVTTKNAADSKSCWPLLLGQDVDSRVAELAAGLHPEPFSKDYTELQSLVDSCRKLVSLAGRDEKGRKGATIDDRFWQLLVRQAKQKDPGRDYEKGRDKFIASVGKESVKTRDALIAELVKNSPLEGAGAGASAAPAEATVPPDPQAMPAGPNPDEAFQAFRKAIAAFRKNPTAASADPVTVAPLVQVDSSVAKALDAEVLVGSREGLDLKAERDGTQSTCKVIVSGDHVATIDLTGGKVVVKGGGEAAWNKHWQAIRFMPIGFRRPGQKLSKDDWLVLSQPEQLKLASEKTLHGLFFAKDGSVLLPPGMEGIDWSAAAKIPWTSRAYPSNDGSLTVKVRAAGQEAFLEASAKIGDRAYTLVEPIEFDRTNKVIRRLDEAWYERLARNQPLEKDMKPENELTKLGFKDGVPAADMPDRGNTLPAAVQSLLPSGYSKNDARTLLSQWCPAKASNAKTAFNHDNVKTLEALRDLVRAMADDETSGFGGDRWQAYKVAHKEPSYPGEFKLQPLQKRENEAEDAFKKRSDDDAAEQKKKYEQALKPWQDWRAAGEKQVQADVRDPVELWRYIQRRQKVEDGDKPSKEIDPDLAAVHVLFGLDGLIVAKVKRAQLDELLHRISIASLFEGDVNQPWTIDGLGQVSVPVARLDPAPLQAGAK